MRNTILEARNDHKAMIDAVLAAIKENTAVRIGSAASVSLSDEFKNTIQGKWDNVVQKIKPILKKEDRIMWYLRFYRQYLISQYLNKDIFDPVKIQKIISDYDRKVGFPYEKEAIGAISIVNHLSHFLSLPIPEIQNYQFRNQPAHVILDEFEALEQEWKKTVSSMFIDNDSEILIDFKDGWFWVNTKEASCSKEADAMGHCGNSPRSHTDDQLLSLRKGKEIGGDRYWEPHLTFILNDNGQLTEMKGKGNDKPSDRYHPMIIKLLLHPIVQGIVGGGYLPENNFSISDLSDDQARALVTQKPALANSSLMLEMNDHQITEEIAAKVIEELDTLGDSTTMGYLSIDKVTDNNGDELFYLIVEQWDDANGIARTLGNSDLEQMCEVADDNFFTVANWIEESDAEKALREFIDEAEDDDIEHVEHLVRVLQSKLGVSEEDVLPALFHVFPKSMQSLYEEWKEFTKTSAALHARNYIENITWYVPDAEIRHNDNDTYYLRIPVITAIEMVDDYNQRDSGYSDGYLEAVLSEGWSTMDTHDNEDLHGDIDAFYSKHITLLIEKILDLFETEDQLSFDF